MTANAANWPVRASDHYRSGLIFSLEDGSGTRVAAYLDQFNRRWIAKRENGQMVWKKV